MLSLNDVITAAIAVAAVTVPAVAVYITVNSNQRAARSALTELTLKIAEKAKKYGPIEDKSSSEAYDLYLDIIVLARQADDLVRQLRSKFPESVGITIAQALELVNEWWYADHYWGLACETADPLFRARTTSFWAFALFTRGELERGRAKAEQAARGLELSTTQAAIVTRRDLPLDGAHGHRVRHRLVDHGGRRVRGHPPVRRPPSVVLRLLVDRPVDRTVEGAGHDEHQRVTHRNLIATRHPQSLVNAAV